MDYSSISLSLLETDAYTLFSDCFFDSLGNDYLNWDADEQGLEFDANMSPERQSTSPLPDASTEEKTGVRGAEDAKDAGDDSDQDTQITSNEEASTEAISKDKPTCQDIHLTISQVEKATSLGVNLEFHLMLNEGARIEAGEEGIAKGTENVAEVQATGDEKDLSQSAHQEGAAESSDTEPTLVQHGGIEQEHEPATEEASKQCSTQNSEIEATAINSAEQDHGDTNKDSITVADVKVVYQIPDPGSEERNIGVQEEPKSLNGDTDNAGQSRGEVKGKDRRNGNVKKAKDNLVGSKDNPILLDDDEKPPSQTSRYSTQPLTPPLTPPSLTPGRNKKRKRELRRPATYSNKEGELSTNASSRLARCNQGRRKIEGMNLWGDQKFLEMTACNLEIAWQMTREIWIKMTSLIERDTGADDKLSAAVAKFEDEIGIMCKRLEDKEGLNLGSAFKVKGCWEEVDKRLEELKCLDKMGKDTVKEFSQTLDQFEYGVEIYSCIHEYPDSIDSKDEDYDKDFKARRRSKVQRR